MNDDFRFSPNLKTLLFLLLAAITILYGCNQAGHQNGKANLLVENSGLRVEDVHAELNRQRLTAAEVPADAVLSLVIKDIKGLKMINGKFRLGAEITVTDQNQQVIVHYPDIFASYDSTGLDPSEAGTLTIPISTGAPLLPGGRYRWKCRLWDKYGQGVMTTEEVIHIR